MNHWFVSAHIGYGILATVIGLVYSRNLLFFKRGSVHVNYSHSWDENIQLLNSSYNSELANANSCQVTLE